MAEKNPRYAAKMSTTILSENGQLYAARDISEQQAPAALEDSDEDEESVESRPLLNHDTTVMRVMQVPSPIFLLPPKGRSTPIRDFGFEFVTPSNTDSKHSSAENDLPDICKSAQESLEKILVIKIIEIIIKIKITKATSAGF